MGSVERTREIRRRRIRRAKLKKLHLAYSRAKTDGDKVTLLEKARKISPLFSFE